MCHSIQHPLASSSEPIPAPSIFGGPGLRGRDLTEETRNKLYIRLITSSTAETVSRDTGYRPDIKFCHLVGLYAISIIFFNIMVTVAIDSLTFPTIPHDPEMMIKYTLDCIARILINGFAAVAGVGLYYSREDSARLHFQDRQGTQLIQKEQIITLAKEGEREYTITEISLMNDDEFITWIKNYRETEICLDYNVYKMVLNHVRKNPTLLRGIRMETT